MPRILIRKRWLLAIVFVVIICLTVWGFVIEPNRLVVNEVNLPIPEVDARFGNLKVALISDLHVGSPWVDLKKLRELVVKTNAVKPDLILLAGDFVVESVIGGQFVDAESIAAELSKLNAPLGTFAVLGNHDWVYDGKRVTTALKSVGIEVIENGAARIERDRKHIWLLGIADAWTRKPDFGKALAEVTDEAPVIAFTHNPDIFPNAPERVLLMLAGHTHGGQVNLPFVGRLVVPSKYNQRYAIGHIIENGRHLYVSPGVGTSIFPVRFRVPPEITVLDL
jgi:predicted MPP superfamily phosphohydrolase